MKLTLKLAHKGLILVAVPLIFEVAFVAILLTLLAQAEREVRREAAAKEVIQDVTSLTQCLTGGAAIGYDSIAGRVFLERYRTALKPIPNAVQELEQLGGNNPAQEQMLRHFRELVEQLSDKSAHGQELLDKGKSSEATKYLNSLTPLLADVWMESDKLIKVVRQIEQENPVIQTGYRELIKQSLYAGVALNILIAISLVFYFNRGTVRRLGLVMDNAERLADGRPFNPPLNGGDEIARLDRVFNDTAEALRKTARRERAIVDNASDVICSVDAASAFVNVNPASEKAWGFTPAQLIGRPLADIIVPEDLTDTFQSISQIISGESAPAFENRIRCRDGSLRYALWSGQWSGEDQMLYCVAHDITERKLVEDEIRASEARIRRIIESLPVGLLVVDENGTIEMINPAIEQLLGYDPKELVGHELKCIFQSASTSENLRLSEDLDSTGTGRLEERDAIKKDSSLVPVEFQLTEFYGSQGRRFLAIVIDITEKREIEQRKQEFISIVSHDLRSPLTSLKLFLGLLGEGWLGELTDKGKSNVRIAEQNTTRLLNLVKDLLDIERLSAGKMPLRKEPVSIGGLMKEAVEAIQQLADERKIAITLQDGNVKAIADAERLIQVLVNLLTNAIKFSPDGSEIVVSAVARENQVFIQVIDQGRGVPAHLRTAIFERFKQVRDSDAREKKGTGLGLPICKSIVEQHGGSIGIDSEEGKGSTFWFSLPAGQ